MNTLSQEDALLLLNGLSKIGPISARRILETTNDDPCKVFSLSRTQLLRIQGVGPKMADSILDSSNHVWLEKEKSEIKKRGWSFLYGEKIPTLLHHIYDTPIGLYSHGEIPAGPYVSIVGTRQPSLYGQRICQEIAKGLAEYGFCVVSGLARGIDSIAHRATLGCNGKTIAFLGSGLDIVYPPENTSLFCDIVRSGAVVSEFPLGRKADRRTFPMRNRLVSGISSAVIVIESALSGGSLITAQFAADQGRIVFAVPGRVDQPASAGCNELIRNGAILVRNANDVVEEIQTNILPGMTFSNRKQTSNRQEETFSNPSDTTILSADEKTILNLLKDGSILGVDELIESSELDFAKVSSTLSMLEICGDIAKRTDGRFEIK